MIEWLQTIVFISLGLFGGLGHYLKKRYFDKSISMSFTRYLLSNKYATAYTTIAIIVAEVQLAEREVGDLTNLTLIISALTLGYTIDSSLNRVDIKEHREG